MQNFSVILLDGSFHDTLSQKYPVSGMLNVIEGSNSSTFWHWKDENSWLDLQQSK